MKTLYLIRHAHREIIDRSLDNGLSKKGWSQAERLSHWIQSRSLPPPWTLETSPKLRCQQTLAPLSEALQHKTHINLALEEQREHEGPEDFGKRVLAWLREWDQSPEKVRVACSHGDWIPILIAICTGKRVSVAKGSVSILEWEEGEFHSSTLTRIEEP